MTQNKRITSNPDHAGLHDFGSATTKVPPAWDQRYENQYPFRKYLHDLGIWAVTTDLEDSRQAGAVALRLTGVAREVA
eukprot:16132206-Heterocapsa_arctica.AAC.1